MEQIPCVKVSILDYFGEIKDPRKEINKLYPLDEILLISLCAMLGGAESFNDIEDFGIQKEEWLRQFLALEHGIPSHDTIRRIFCLINPQHFNACFQEWTQSIRQRINGEIVAIDGKSLRRTGKDKDSIIHLVSAWAGTNRLVLGQLRVADKSNEITAIPHLLRALELSGCIVTIDAMGTQKNIAKEINEADADYVLSLKGNQSLTHKEIKSFLDDAILRREKHIQSHTTVEKDHGRIETRTYWISDQINWFAGKKAWEKLHTVGAVESRRDIGGKITVERRYFLCSIPPDPKSFAKAVREHWGIENQLHWVLDVSLQEDQSRVRTGYAAENLALLRKLALNTIRADTSQKRQSVKGRQKIAAWSESYLLTLLKLNL